MNSTLCDPSTQPRGITQLRGITRPVSAVDVTELHIGDHDPLLIDRSRAVPSRRRKHPGRAGQGGLDAIVMPTSRRSPNLSGPLARAAEVGCPLIVVCSGAARGAEILARLKRGPQAAVYVVDVGHGGHIHTTAEGYGRLNLQLQTDRFAESLGYTADVAFKRNLGLLIARAMGWHTILFLDDDVLGLGAEHVRQAVDLLTGDAAPFTSAVSWKFTAFEDNSSVCHAHRLAGGDQGIFVGSAALAVTVDDDVPFFPSVYNEDWLFHVPFLARRRVALAGVLGQVPYDPHDASARRAAHQEFGDTLAESLFRGLHEAGPGRDWLTALRPAFDHTWWADKLERRRRFLYDVQARLARTDAHSGALRSLSEAVRTQTDLKADHLVDFTQAWARDSERWRAKLQNLASAEPLPLSRLKSVIESFGVGAVTTTRSSIFQRAHRIEITHHESAWARTILPSY